jgi:pimeloyl-ACP methyl ester carboxylesterase
MLLAVACIVLAAATAAEASAKVYLMRGLMDVSTGLDDLAAKLKRRGIAAIVGSYTDQDEMAEKAIQNYRSDGGRPIVIVGHSLGADAAIGMAETLKAAKVPVALVVAFSPAASQEVPTNVARIVNYYQSNSAWNHIYTGARGFKGSLRNVDLAADDNIHHFNIEKVERLHTETIGMIAAAGDGAPRPAGAKQTAQSPAPKN